MSNEFFKSKQGSLALGLMSGTSLDGIDAALIFTDGVTNVKAISSFSIQYDHFTKAKIKQAISLAKSMGVGSKLHPEISLIENELTTIHAKVIDDFLKRENLNKDKIDVIGFHGQTINHIPDEGFTWQIGNGALLARLTGIDVINNFRSADVQFGGQGAPLAPLYHLAIFKSQNIKSPCVFLNIGGVSNVTYIGSDGGDFIMGFDTGPGNALIDDWVLKNFGQPFDKYGAFASAGKINETILNKLLSHPYFIGVPPKSLDRNSFDVTLLENLAPNDGAATLTAFTAVSIKASLKHLPECPACWYVTGGGRHNDFLMSLLKENLGENVFSIDDLNVSGDSLEAEAFAYLAVRAQKQLPITLPETTGVDMPRSGGELHRAS